MESIKVFDVLNWSNDKDIKSLIKSEKIYYSELIKKINHYGIKQERNILLTDKSLYYFKKKAMDRKIDYNLILGITLSKSNEEFIIHGDKGEYDLYFFSPDKILITCLIAKLYESLTKKPLKICQVDEKSIKNFVLSKKEKNKDNTKSRMDDTFIIDTYEFLKANAKELVEKKQNVGTIFSNHKSVKDVKFEDFQMLKVIGRGSYGKVCLVRYKPTQEIFAMKSLKKDVLLDQDQVESTILEKKILQSLDYPFLVGMVFCFQTEERIYFIMPFIRGGELFQHLRNEKYFPEEKVRFYAAIIGLSLDYLHRHGIIYRDIKPENILMDENGYLKLVDFGMAKMIKEGEKANSFCGTPEYLAPEIITGEGHNGNADWWSYGILIYEMLCGIPPFFCENTEKMYQLIQRAEVKYPKKINVSDNARDLIEKLLMKRQNQRIGAKDGFNEIKQHPFFAGFDFQALEDEKLEAPFKPKLTDILDVSNFDNEFTNEDVEQTPIAQNCLDFINRNQDQFEDFSK